MRDGLIGADLLAELLAVGDVGDAELERLLRDADGLHGERREQSQPDRLEIAVDRLAVGRPEPPERPRLVDGRERLTLGRDGGHVVAQHPVDGVEVRNEPVELDRPGVVVQLRQGGKDDGGGEERARVERPARLFEEDRLVDEGESAAATLLRNGDAEPAELAQLGERRVRVCVEERARLPAQLLLLLAERELHQRVLGRPSTRSAMMLRKISEVPASIVLPRERSCWCCQ